MPARAPLAALVAVLAFSASVSWASSALTGTWTGNLDGQRLVATFDGKGGGQVDGRPIRYQIKGGILLVEDQGQVAMYQFQVQGNQLVVAGGQLSGMLTLNRGTAADAQQAAAQPRAQVGGGGGSPADLVGKWCKASNFSANSGGGSSSSACFELRADGSYVYGSERSMSAYAPGMYGGTSGSSSDSGRWTATPSGITAHSRSGSVSTYQLERRNHPKNRDPMICLDGTCYVTYWRKAPW